MEFLGHRGRLQQKSCSGDIANFTSNGIGLLAVLLLAVQDAAFLADPHHDRAWILDAASRGSFSCANYVAENFYAQVSASIAIGFGALSATLRGKKLISKEVEQTMVAVFTQPAVSLAAHAVVPMEIGR